MPVFIIALTLGAVMFGTSCEKENLTIANDTTTLNDRGGKNGMNNSGDKMKQDICSCIVSNFPVEELSDIELNSLSHMLEEEKLARDVYLTLYDKWSERVFANISKAEQRHMDAILCLYDKYNIEDLVSENEIGVFKDEGLQSLYTALIDQGKESLSAALTVGATIEDLDIFDLIDLSQQADNKDLLAVFSELTKGSRNHMRAFISRLNLEKTAYIPQFITHELFDSIINSDRERGGSICGNSNNGKNRGNRTGNCNGNGGNGDHGNGGKGNGGNGNG